MDNLQWDAILLRYDCNSYSCALLGGSQCMFTEFSQYCTATCSTVLGISNIIQVRIVLYFHSIALIFEWGFRGECSTALFPDTSSTRTPLVCHSHPRILLFLPTFSPTWDFFTFLHFSIQLFSPTFPRFFHFCATFNSDAGSAAKPSPATISRFARISPRNHHLLSGFLPAILARFLSGIIAWISLKNYHCLSTICSRFLITFFQDTESENV